MLKAMRPPASGHAPTTVPAAASPPLTNGASTV